MVRHSDAGDRSRWDGDDRRRPLSEVGRKQARALVELHAHRPIARLLTSPYLRCLQTIEPLATARGLAVEEEDALREGVAFDVVDRCLRTLSGTDAVVCSHGDVVGAIVTALHHRGVDPGGAMTWPKASTWVLDQWPDTTSAVFVDRPPLR